MNKDRNRLGMPQSPLHIFNHRSSPNLNVEMEPFNQHMNAALSKLANEHIQNMDK